MTSGADQVDNSTPPPLSPLPDAPLVETFESEVVLLDAMAAYDNLGRHMVMGKRHTMTKSQVDALMAIYVFGRLTMTQISDHLAVSKEQASRTIGPLVERGILERSRRSENHRIVEVALTSEGRELVRKTRQEVLQTISAQLQTLSKRDRKQLISSSQKALVVLRKLLNDPH